MNISSGTIARTVILVLALINQILSMLGYKIIPIENETINDIVTLAFTVCSSIAAWWKNNSFTSAAIQADNYKNSLKEE